MSRPDAPDVPLLLFDGECGFCTACVDWLAPRLERDVRIVPWQWADLEPLGLSRAEAAARVWWIEPGGPRRGGAAAVAAALSACRMPWPVLGRVLRAPGLRLVAAGGYALVSRIRGRLPGSEPACRRGRAADGRVRDPHAARSVDPRSPL